MSVIVEQRRQKCFPVTLIIDCCTPHMEYVSDFLTNIRLSDIYNLPGESVPMNPEIFSAMRAGNRDFLEKMRSYGTPMACLKNDKGDSILHVAAALGHLELVESIISECPSLLFEPNWKDQIPIHAAARAGRLAVVETLIRSITYLSARILPEEERERFNIYVLKDIDGDIPLHAAIKGCHLEAALCLVNASKHASFLENNDGISPLYMAVEAGGLALVKEMLNGLGYNSPDQGSNLSSQLEGRKSLVHKALETKNPDILDVILNEDPTLGDERDEEGRTCLSIGASIGFYKGVCNLLDRSTSGVFECNDDGSFPIHMAVEKGYVDVVKEIIKRCPDSKELLNKQGQNILHIAAKNGKAGSLLLNYIKRLDRKKNHLIEEQDADGNTPLHLATIYWRPRTVSNLTSFTSRKILEIQNNDGLTAMDIAEASLQSRYVFRERMTLMVLLCACSRRGFQVIPTSGMTLRSRSEHHLSGGDKYKDNVNALLLVATLVATVAFAAGFTVPGGFSSSPPNLGMAILANELDFCYFLVCNTLAMQCSVVAIVALIWAQLGDPELIHKAFHLALPSLFVALASMSSAFLFGVVATRRSQDSFLFNVIFNTITAIFFHVMVLLLGPYVIPQLPGVPFLQPVTGLYLHLLLLFVNEDDHVFGSGHTCEKKRVNSEGSSGMDQVQNSKVT
ncbi:hypothetical protein AXX17_AT4G04320 [Arabidopsis thaliana]|uniref:PGG domain-containing protein n=1 Tax=Arabidopsis thaliana TaxID=3702 RepID=A0A178UX15_ARATH|nr:hypothetical protein AXX17_AT4G04320 [Arabidopsis thaliana]